MVYTEIFDNLQSFASTISKRETNATFARYKKTTLNSVMEGSSSKLGTHNFEEAENLLINGDRNNLDKLKKANIQSILHSNERSKSTLKVQKNVCGCLPNIPLYLIGTPNNMLNFKRTQVKSRVLNMVVNAAVNCDVTGEQITEAGANIVSVVRELERCNIRVNLYVSFFTTAKGLDYLGALINIKKSSSPLNMLNISYPLINPAMLRRHFLRYIETVPVKIDKSITKGYGRAVLFQDMLRREPKLNKFKDAVIIDIQNMIGSSVSDMVKVISDKTK